MAVNNKENGMIKMDDKIFLKWSVKKENLSEERRSRDEFIFFQRNGENFHPF